MLLGLVQSMCFPSFIHIVANWFSKKNRGIVAGLFCTCVNVGNIVGVQLGQGLLGVFNDKWQWLFILLAAVFTVWALVLLLLLVQHPGKIGIIVDEEVVS